MQRIGGLIIVTLVLANAGLAGLIPFQVSGESAVPTTVDSIAIYELIVTSDSTGNLNWLFRLGGSPSQDITFWVGFPGAESMIIKGMVDSTPTSMDVNCLLPGDQGRAILPLYEIIFPANKITLNALSATTLDPWNPISTEGIGEYETWEAVLPTSVLSNWGENIDRLKVTLNLPLELQELWEFDKDGFQFSADPPHQQMRNGAVVWEFRRWVPDKDLTIQVSTYRPFLQEGQLLRSGMIHLPEKYFGDTKEYGDSLLNGYMWMPEFGQMETAQERAVFARTYLWLRQNEILARHGFVFESEPAMRAFFDKQPWYKPDPFFKTEMMTEIEMKNYWKLINRRALFGSMTPARKE
jgi:hypothetical protein